MTKEMVVWMMEDQHLNVQDHPVFIHFTIVSKNSASINPIGHKTHGFLHCAVLKVFYFKLIFAVTRKLRFQLKMSLS